MKVLTLLLAAATLEAQPLDPAKLLKPPTDSWPTYNGDYSGRRNSPLTQINSSNVKNLALSWVFRSSGNVPPAFGGNSIKATPLVVNGIIYFANPDNAWAVDARTGPPARTGLDLDRIEALWRSPGSRACCFSACAGSTTTQDRSDHSRFT